MNSLRALRVLIVDDEELARLRLRTLLADCVAPPAQVLGEAGSAAAALQWLSLHRCDLVLLDIHLPGLDGLQLAERLRALPAAPAVVFVTAHAHHALAAFEVEAVDYLTKPVRRARLQEALARVARLALRTAASTSPGAAALAASAASAASATSATSATSAPTLASAAQSAAPFTQPSASAPLAAPPSASAPTWAPTPEPPAPGWAPTEPMAWPTLATGAEPAEPAEPAGRVAPVISVHERGEWLRVPVHEVLYLKAELKYVTLRTAARTHLVEASLADLEARFARSGRSPFVRVHRNALVAVAAVRAFERRAADAPLTGLGADDDARLDSHGWAVHIGATDEWLAVSRRQLAAVRQALAELG